MSKPYISSSLAFYNNKIVVEDSGSHHNGMEVMMDWEHSIMSASAAYITEGGGDILEIGFGMGIASGYIQSHSISSHTIIENHPQILEKLETWASGKSNVTVVEGDWYTVDGLSTYDGIFLDTFGDDNFNNFKTFALAKIKSGGKITYWNNNEAEYNPHAFDSVSYEQISITPTSNSYTGMENNYYMPKVVV
jgi:protein arginine N-methyltransferase 2